MTHFEAIVDHIRDLHIIDTHEHLPPFESYRIADSDVLSEWLTVYFSSDLRSAGLSQPDLDFVRNPVEDLKTRWAKVEPFWQKAANTAYARVLNLASSDIYGIKEISRETIEELNRRFVEAREQGGHYRQILKEKCGISLSILNNPREGRTVDQHMNADSEFFRSVVELDEYIFPSHRSDIAAVEEILDFSVHSLQDWKKAMALHLEAAMHAGAIGIKTMMGYYRPFNCQKVSTQEAEKEFSRLFSQAHSADISPHAYLSSAFQDHMVHHLLRLSEEFRLPVQFHTGMQEGSGNFIFQSNPILLSELCLEYRNAKFIMFHMGYPYMRELGAMAKIFPNVFIDMCWGHIISPRSAAMALDEWLDSVPANKICGFGGDYTFIDGVYGHQLIARKNIAEILSRRLETCWFSLNRAKEISDRLLVLNPKEIYDI